MDGLLKFLGLTTPLIYATAAYGLFHWLDENASDEAKAALARTMRFKDYKNEQIASALAEVFDRIYSYPLLRWRTFGRSLLFTTVVSAIFVFELSRHAHIVPRYIIPMKDLGQLAIALFFNVFSWEQLWVALLFNVLSDYLSLFVIRPLLIRSGTKPVIGLALGTVSGAAIVVAVNTLRLVGLIAIYVSVPTALKLETLPIELIEHSMPWGPDGIRGLLYAWPAMAVFVWLPLLALGILLARLLTPLTWIVGRTQWFLKEGKEHPLKAIGYVAAVVVFLGTVAGRAVLSA